MHRDAGSSSLSRPRAFRLRLNGRTEPKRPNGHKAQLALSREIERLNRLLEHQRKSITRCAEHLREREDALLKVSADCEGLKAHSAEHAAFLTVLEQLLKLPRAKLSYEERRTRVVNALKCREGIGATAT